MVVYGVASLARSCLRTSVQKLSWQHGSACGCVFKGAGVTGAGWSELRGCACLQLMMLAGAPAAWMFLTARGCGNVIEPVGWSAPRQLAAREERRVMMGFAWLGGARLHRP
jgi:hypothetical protein